MQYTGKLRIHFNRHGAAPLVWCVAPEVDGVVQCEVAVSEVRLGVPVATVYQPKATPDDEDGKPSAWLECHGTLTIVGAIAHVTRSPDLFDRVAYGRPADIVRCDAKFATKQSGSVRCECNEGHFYGCDRNARATVTRDGKRINVCDRCDLTTDSDRHPLTEGA